MLMFESGEELTEYIRAELLCSSEAVTLLMCSTHYINRLVKHGVLVPVITSNREKMFWRSDVLKFKR